MIRPSEGKRPKRIPVLYEDNHLLVVDKPSGLLSVPSPKKEIRTLDRIVNDQQDAGGKTRLYPCHRLDRDTSGVFLFAKGKAVQQTMRKAFAGRRVKKKYIAFVRGRPKPPQGEIRRPVQDYHRKRFARGSRPQSAVTRYRTIAPRKGFSVLEVMPITGRTNQIRIHFSQIGHPILGERLYAFGKDFQVKFRRLALHASELTVPHPKTGREVHVRAPLAQDMRKVIDV